MLTEIYIEALLVDEEAADEVWEAWDCGEISDSWAAWGWLHLCLHSTNTRPQEKATSSHIRTR